MATAIMGGDAVAADLRGNERSRKLVLVLYVLLVAVALYVSLKAVTGIFRLEPDTSHSVILWEGVRQGGLSWLRDWVFTSDNWLLSLVPFQFLAFGLFGAETEVAIVVGWVIFVLAALVSAWIAYQLGARRSAAWVFPGLLFLNAYAHGCGMASYSTSHNITNLWGLVALCLLLKWLQKPGAVVLGLMAMCLVIGAVSDPWMLAAYNIPFSMLGAVLLVWGFMGQEARWSGVVLPPAHGLVRRGVMLLLASLLTILLSKTKLLGLLSFLVGMHFKVGGWPTIGNNAFFLIQTWGGLLNIFPFQEAGRLVASVLSLMVVLSLLLFHLYRASWSGFLTGQRQAAFVVFSFFSIGGIVLAFVIGDTVASIYSARFLLNTLYLIVIALVVLAEYNWKKLSPWLRGASLVVLALFLLSGGDGNGGFLEASRFFGQWGRSSTMGRLPERERTVLWVWPLLGGGCQRGHGGEWR